MKKSIPFIEDPPKKNLLIEKKFIFLKLEQQHLNMPGFWKDGTQIVLKNVASGKSLRINDGHIEAKGGEGGHATWIVKRTNPGQKPAHVKLENKAVSGRYLRVDKRGDLNTGKGGKWCLFEVQKHGGHFTLSSVQNKGHNVGFKNDGSVKPPKNVGHGEHAQFAVHKK